MSIHHRQLIKLSIPIDIIYAIASTKASGEVGGDLVGQL